MPRIRRKRTDKRKIEVGQIADEQRPCIMVKFFRGNAGSGLTYLYSEPYRVTTDAKGNKSYSQRLLGRDWQAIGRLSPRAEAWMDANQHLADGDDPAPAAEVQAPDAAVVANTHQHQVDVEATHSGQPNGIAQ